MRIDTNGYVYFAIKTDNDKLDLEEFNNNLSISPTKFRKKFEDGAKPKCTIWEYSSEKLINPLYYEEIEKLIEKLESHKEEFKQLQLKSPEIVFVLQIVIYLGDETPALHFSNKTINFANYLGAKIDCDIYNIKE